MSEQMMGCPNYKLGLCNNDECSHWGEHKWNALCSSRGDCRNCVCIPIPVEPELWICDHAGKCDNELCSVGKHPITKSARYDVGEDYCYRIKKATTLIPLTPEVNMEYEIIKPVSIKSLEEAGACERELHRFAFLLIDRSHIFNMVTHLALDVVIECASQCIDNIPSGGTGVDSLIRKGFIREKAEEVFYKRGDVFRIDNDCCDCMLVSTGGGNMVLAVVSLDDDDRGNCWVKEQPVKNHMKVTMQEMLDLTAGKPFQLMKK